MPTYIALIDWTEQGVRNFKDTVDRYEAASGQLEALGVSFKEIYWTLGARASPTAPSRRGDRASRLSRVEFIRPDRWRARRESRRCR